MKELLGWCKNNGCSVALGIVGLSILVCLLYLFHRLFVEFPAIRILEGTLS